MVTQQTGCCGIEIDAQLMCRVREGDVHSYTLLLDRHRRPVIRFLHRIVQSEHVAEDLAQEVFLRVYRARGEYEPTAKFSTWLFRIATRVALNWLRSGRRERHRESLDLEAGDRICFDLADGNPTAEEYLLASVRAREIRDAIETLPENQRAAVIMHKYRELDYAQIARALNCSEGAVKSLLYRAYERLRGQLVHFSG